MKDHSKYKYEEDEDVQMIVQSMQFGEKELSETETLALWQEITESARKRHETKRFWSVFRYAAACAASIAVIFGLWRFFYEGAPEQNALLEFAANPVTIGSEVQIVLADDAEYILAGSDSEIQYDEQGRLTVDSQQVAQQQAHAGEKAFNQVIVPWGRRVAIAFADGTRLWLNAGSRAVYPVEFATDRREIFIEGEAYFEVAQDLNRPFVVKTGLIEIKVVGTVFNVNAYPQEQKTQVALINGAVQVAVDGNRQVTQLQPEHIVEINRETLHQEVSQTNDIYDYISWKEGFLQFRSENLDVILRRLERHYATPIDIQTQLEEYKISGKLDLKENIAGTLDIIQKLVPVEYKFENNRVLIRKK